MIRLQTATANSKRETQNTKPETTSVGVNLVRFAHSLDPAVPRSKSKSQRSLILPTASAYCQLKTRNPEHETNMAEVDSHSTFAKALVDAVV